MIEGIDRQAIGAALLLSNNRSSNSRRERLVVTIPSVHVSERISYPTGHWGMAGQLADH